MYLYLGGILVVLAGFLEFLLGNKFIFTVFSGYGELSFMKRYREVSKTNRKLTVERNRGLALSV